MIDDQPVVKVWQPGPGYWSLAVMPFTNYASLSAEVRHLDIGHWSMELDSQHPAVAELARPDAWRERLVTVTYGGFTFTGLPQDRDRSHNADTDSFTVEGQEATGFLAWPLTRPVPGSPLGQQGAAQADVFPAGAGVTAPAEDVARHYLTANLGRWATGSVPPVVAPSQSRGSQVKGRARMRSLWRVVQPLARRGGIGVRVRLVETNAVRAVLTVEFYSPADRTATAKLSDRIGTLRSWDSTQGAPAATAAVVGDAGAGTFRTFVSATADQPASWGGRIETFVDASDTFDPNELTQRGQEALDEGAAAATFSLVAADTQMLRFGVDYGLGDLVTVEVGTATAVDRVSAVSLTVTEDAITVAPTVGDPDKPDPLLRIGQLIRTTGRKTDFLQTRDAPPT